MPDIFDATKLKSARQPAAKETFVETTPEFIEPASPEVAPELVTEARGYDRPHREVDEYSELMRQEAPSNNPFHAFAPKPLQVFFDSQDKAERVILLLRKSPITQIPWVLITIVLLFMPLLFGAVGFLNFLPARFQLAGVIFWYLLVTGFMLESFLSWFFNVYIITDERVIDVDFLSLIYKNISSAKIDKIEDVTAETGGALRSVFDFGTVKIQTAGSDTEIEFEDVPQPGKITRLINELLIEEEREKIEGRVN
jgi:membrane protein YdbS with pleckstrin-like domain